LLGNLYKLSNRKKSAISSYKSALLISPLAIEIIEKLIHLGVNSNEIISVVDASVSSSSTTIASSSVSVPAQVPPSSSTTSFTTEPPLPALIPASSLFSSLSLSSLPPPPPLKPNPLSSQYQQLLSSLPSYSSSSSQLISNGWLHTLIIGLVHKYDLHNEKSLIEFQKLSLLYPKNAYLSLHVAEVSTLINQNEVALSIYRQIRRHDNYIITKMYQYGKLLYIRQDSSELSRLVDDVINTLPHSYVGMMLID